MVNPTLVPPQYTKIRLRPGEECRHLLINRSPRRQAKRKRPTGIRGLLNLAVDRVKVWLGFRNGNTDRRVSEGNDKWRAIYR